MSQSGSHFLRDLDYINPRQKMPSQALPPEVRAKLGLGKARDTSKSSRRRSSIPPSAALNKIDKTLFNGSTGAVKRGVVNDLYENDENTAPGGFAPNGEKRGRNSAPSAYGTYGSYGNNGSNNMNDNTPDNVFKEVYCGAANIRSSEMARKGKAGAGTDWENPNGHAFVRRGTSQARLETLRQKKLGLKEDLVFSLGKKRGL